MGVGAIARSAIFLDRDGTLVEEVYYPETGEREAPMCPEDVRLIDGAADALRRLARSGFLLIVVSNQGAYAKGKIGLRSLWLCHEVFLKLMADEGVNFDGSFYSFSHPDGVTPFFSGPSLDRKPNPYNLLIAAAQFDIDPANSWMIGDRESDVLCGRSAGTRTIRIAMQDGVSSEDSKADIVAKSLAEATDEMLSQTRAGIQID